MSGAELKAKATRFTEECWNKGDLGFMDELFAPGVITHRSGREDMRSLEEYKQYLQDFRTDFPDLHVDIHEIIAEGNAVSDRWAISGTFTGPGKVFPVPGTGRKVVCTGTWFGHFEDGKIVEDWYTYDLMAILQQLGLMPAPEQQQ